MLLTTFEFPNTFAVRYGDLSRLSFPLLLPMRACISFVSLSAVGFPASFRSVRVGQLAVRRELQRGRAAAVGAAAN